LVRAIVLIPHLFRLVSMINFRKDYSPPSSLPSQPYTRSSIFPGHKLLHNRSGFSIDKLFHDVTSLFPLDSSELDGDGPGLLVELSLSHRTYSIPIPCLLFFQACMTPSPFLGYCTFKPAWLVMLW
jgi:hypothetical protein